MVTNRKNNSYQNFRLKLVKDWIVRLANSLDKENVNNLDFIKRSLISYSNRIIQVKE